MSKPETRDPVTPPATRSDAPLPRKRKRKTSRGTLLALWALALPGVIWYLIFDYAPLSGLVVAFKRFNIKDGIFGSPWVGLDNFRYFLATGDAPRIVANTVFLNALFLSSSLLAGLILAIMLNEFRLKTLKKVSQSVIFFPYFVSPIIVSIILQVMLSGSNGKGGVVNAALDMFGIDPVSWYTTPGPWPWILTIVKVWQLGGYTSIIFLAAITSIPDEVYEAGMLDGASRFRMAISITAPLLKPTAAVLIVLGVGRIFFGDFGTIYAIVGDNGTLFSTTDVIDTYVFRSLRVLGDFGTTAAVGLFQSVVGFIFIVAAVMVQRRLDRDGSIL